MMHVCAIGARSPRRMCAQGAAAAVLLGAAGANAAVTEYVTQIRRVTATIYGSNSPATQTLAAPNQNPWSATAAVSRSVNGHPENVAQASQSSALEPDLAYLYGSVLLNDNNPTDGGTLAGLAFMQTAFMIDQPQGFVLHGRVDSTAPAYAAYSVRLNGPGGVQVLRDQDDGLGDYLYRGTMTEPGRYFLVVQFEQGMLDAPQTAVGMGTFSAILTVPCPGAAALLPCAALIIARRRR